MNIPAIHSSIWYKPIPGHSPRFDPKKFRESMKLNRSTVVFLSLTLLLKFNPNTDDPLKFDVVSSWTSAEVLTKFDKFALILTNLKNYTF